MPYKAKHPCNYPGCPELVAGRFCEEHQKKEHVHYNRHRRDPETHKRYGTAWRRIRAAYVRVHPLCEMCEAAGRLRPTEEVHHIVPLANGGTHDWSNLQALCKSCHSRITVRATAHPRGHQIPRAFLRVQRARSAAQKIWKSKN